MQRPTIDHKTLIRTMSHELPTDVTDTVAQLEQALDETETIHVPAGPMEDGAGVDDEITISDVRAHEYFDLNLGQVYVVEVELDMYRSEYYEALITEDKARRSPPNAGYDVTPQRSFGSAIYSVMAEHGIQRPDGTPELGVRLGSYYDNGELFEERPIVQGIIPAENAAIGDGGLSVTVIDTGMTLAGFLSIGALGMARQLVDLGEEYSVKNDLAATNLDVGVYDDAAAGTTGDSVSDTSDLAALTSEPSNGNYTRQTSAFSAEDISGDWGIDNDASIQFDMTSTTGTVDSWFVEVNFTAVDTTDGTGTDHLLCTGALSQEYDLSNLTDLDINAGDGSGAGVGWTFT